MQSDDRKQLIANGPDLLLRLVRSGFHIELSNHGRSSALNIKWHISSSEAWKFEPEDPPASLAPFQTARVMFDATPNQSDGHHGYNQPLQLTINYSDLSGVRFRRVFRVEIREWNDVRFDPSPTELLEPPDFTIVS